MENVPELLRSAEYASSSEAAERRASASKDGVLNAADYGVPQTRRRAIVIGVARRGRRRGPSATHCDPDAGPLGRRRMADLPRGR